MKVGSLWILNLSGHTTITTAIATDTFTTTTMTTTATTTNNNENNNNDDNNNILSLPGVKIGVENLWFCFYPLQSNWNKNNQDVTKVYTFSFSLKKIMTFTR